MMQRLVIICGILVALVIGALIPRITSADHLMCHLWEPTDTITVWAWPRMNAAQNNGLSYSDVQAAVARWNEASRRAIGRDLFRLVGGRWQDADVLVHAGSAVDRTWVWTDCSPGFKQRGNNRAIVFVGKQDSWRNAKLITHELGHAAGFADHVAPSDNSTGYINAKKGGSYRGIMQNYSFGNYGLSKYAVDDTAMIQRWFD